MLRTGVFRSLHEREAPEVVRGGECRDADSAVGIRVARTRRHEGVERQLCRRGGLGQRETGASRFKRAAVFAPAHGVEAPGACVGRDGNRRKRKEEWRMENGKQGIASLRFEARCARDSCFAGLLFHCLFLCFNLMRTARRASTRGRGRRGWRRPCRGAPRGTACRCGRSGRRRRCRGSASPRGA